MIMFTEVVLCQMTHNSGPLHRVIRAGAARRSTNASLMPRRTNCKPTTQQDEREAGVGRGEGRDTVREKTEGLTEYSGLSEKEIRISATSS